MPVEHAIRKGNSYWYSLNWKLVWGAKVTAFFPYTSNVRETIFEVEYESKSDICKFHDNLIVKALESGVAARLDNKTVFELSTLTSKLYIGFKDGTMRVGLAVESEWQPITSTNNEYKRR